MDVPRKGIPPRLKQGCQHIPVVMMIIEMMVQHLLIILLMVIPVCRQRVFDFVLVPGENKVLSGYEGVSRGVGEIADGLHLRITDHGADGGR